MGVYLGEVRVFIRWASARIGVIPRNALERERKYLVGYSENNPPKDLCIIRQKWIDENWIFWIF